MCYDIQKETKYVILAASNSICPHFEETIFIWSLFKIYEATQQDHGKQALISIK